MFESAAQYVHVKNFLTEADLFFLKMISKQNLRDEHIPCFSLVNHLDTPTYQKIKNKVEEQVNHIPHYLNDFYIYTETLSKAGWHMDTELFTFEQAVNVWILLSPKIIMSPLCFIHQINDIPERYYHVARIEGDRCVFGNFSDGKNEERPLKQIEATQIYVPDIQQGDLLIFNPKFFHKTNVDDAKHAFVIKFIFEGKNGFMSENQVDPYLWPEVETFNALVKPNEDWDKTIQRIRCALRTKEGKENLSSGFYPERFELYKKMVQLL